MHPVVCACFSIRCCFAICFIAFACCAFSFLSSVIYKVISFYALIMKTLISLNLTKFEFQPHSFPVITAFRNASFFSRLMLAGLGGTAIDQIMTDEWR